MLNAPDLLRTRGQEKDRGMVKDGEGRLSKEEKIALERVLWALEDLRTVDKTLSLHHATALLRVAISEGKSVAELVREAGVAQSVMSRHLLDLGPMDRNRNPGLGLIQHQLSALNMRIHEVSLTPKGLSLAKKMANKVVGALRR